MFHNRLTSPSRQALRAARRRSTPLWLEALEDRRVPAGVLSVVPFTSLNPQPVEGAGATVQVATAFDTGPIAPAFKISIDWGDGTILDKTSGIATPIAGSPNAFSITGTHTYAEESSSVTPPFTTPVAVTIQDTANVIGPVTVTSEAAVLDAALSQGNPVTATATPFSGAGQANTAATLAAFKAAIGGSANAVPAPQNGGFRTITWDGVKVDGTDAAAGPNSTVVITPGHTVGIPLNRFEGSGVYFGAVYAVSDDGFVTVNPNATGLFPAFSPTKSFAMFNDNGIDFKFVAPATTSSTIVNAASRGFGAVFLNVTQANTTSIQYFNGNQLLATVFAPVGSKGLPSFVGALFPSPVVTRVVLSLGNDVIFKFDGTTTTSGPADGGSTNLVATDDWAFAEPVPTINGLPIVTGAQGTTNAAVLPGTGPTAAVPFTGVVGSFSDLDPNGNAKDFTATINWGDGHSTNGTVTKNAQGGFDVAGTNTYVREGRFPVNIDIQDFGGGNGISGSIPVVSINNTLNVADAPLTLTAVTPVNATAQVSFTGTLATFKDTDPQGNVGQYSASINWGDGTPPTPGTIAPASGGGFMVSGTHTFAKAGKPSVVVTINDVGGATLTATTGATVTTAPQTIGGFDTTSATFFLRNANSAGGPDAGVINFGLPGFLPIVGDWNGDGVATIGVFDPKTATWFLRNENSAGGPDAGQFPFGAPGDVPVVGDWTGTGHTGIGVFRPSNGMWLLRNEVSGGGADAGSFTFGAANDVPVTGDWTGLGHAGIGVFRQGTWLLRNEVSGGSVDAGNFAYGMAGDLPVTGDWNAMGHTGIGIFRPSNFTFFLRNEVSGGGVDAGTIAFGNPNFLPLAGTYSLPGHLFLAPDGSPASGAPAVGGGQLRAAVAAALDRLRAAGVAPAVVSKVAAANYQVAALPAGVLGLTAVPERTVTISPNAAGQGWFVDPTPGQDEEFSPGVVLLASAGSPASGKVDLLTAVLHEMGHLAGRDDVSSAAHPFDLMAESLVPGERRIRALDQVFAGG